MRFRLNPRRPPPSEAKSERGGRAPRAARRHRRWLRSVRRETNAEPQAERAGSLSCRGNRRVPRPRSKTWPERSEGLPACEAAKGNKAWPWSRPPKAAGSRSRRRRPQAPERSEGGKGLRSPRSKTRGAGAAPKARAGGAKAGVIFMWRLPSTGITGIQSFCRKNFAPPAAEFHSAAGAPKACAAV